jgi:hypothetical protein
MNNTSAFARYEGETLIIGNAYLERRLAARADAPCVTISFVNKETGRDYLRPGSREFSLSANGRAMTTRDFVYQRAEIHEGDPTEAIVHLRTTSPPLLTLELHYQVYSAHPVVRKWLVVRNHGTETVTLSDLDWEDLNLLVDTPASAEVWTDYFTRREKAVAVTMDDCALLVNDNEHGEGFILATEAPGPLKRLESYAQPGRIAAGYNRDDETIFERILAPSEEFQTPASFILTFANPIPQDVVDGEYARFVEERLTICDVAQVPSITVNTWVPHLSELSPALLLEQIALAAELGVDAYQVDDGWYDRMGDWNANLARFPNGLEEIADYARAHGMRFGLWMAVATVDEASQVFREHPEWIARDRHGEPNRHPIPGTVTMCLDSGFYDFILDKIDAVISRYGVELLKLDLSTVRNLYAPGRYPGCFATNHAHRSPRESHVRILARLFDLVRALKSRHPQCLIDVSYELYGVMDGTDLALTQVADQNWFTNITSPHEVNLRREIYQRGRVTRPWTLNYGGAVLNHPTAPHYGLFSALTGHGVFWGDLADLDAETRAHYRRWFEWVKEQRTYSDFYRYYRVSDVFPVPDGVSSRDYRHAIPTARYGVRPLGIHPPAFEPLSEHPGEIWDGVARLDPRGEGPIFLFRPAACLSPFFQLRIPWVEPAARYRLTDVTEQRELGVFAGAELIEPGVEISIAEPAHAKVILVRRVDEGASQRTKERLT